MRILPTIIYIYIYRYEPYDILTARDTVCCFHNAVFCINEMRELPIYRRFAIKNRFPDLNEKAPSVTTLAMSIDIAEGRLKSFARH